MSALTTDSLVASCTLLIQLQELRALGPNTGELAELHEQALRKAQAELKTKLKEYVAAPATTA